MSDPTLAPQDPPSAGGPDGTGPPAGEPPDSPPPTDQPAGSAPAPGATTQHRRADGPESDRWADDDPGGQPGEEPRGEPEPGPVAADRRPAGHQRARGRGWLPPRVPRVGRPAHPLAAERLRGRIGPRHLARGWEQLVADQQHPAATSRGWPRRLHPVVRRRSTRRRPYRPPRHPLAAFSSMIVFGLLAAFFAWQSAEPFWLSIGHGIPGTATVTRCDAVEGTVADRDGPGGATYPCVTFTPANGAFQAVDVTLLGAGDTTRDVGASVPARMVAAGRERAYVAEPAALHLRWSAGMLLVLASSAGIVWGTGAARLDGRWARRRAVLLSLAGPLLLAAGFLAAAV